MVSDCDVVTEVAGEGSCGSLCRTASDDIRSL